jgi:cytosine/uracil/thiamine/allantoin permease
MADIENSPLYSPDLAPVSSKNRNWNKWNLAALWVGMAVCIPTYILASYMIRNGISWQISLVIIGLANLVITLPMVLNGHAGVKYGIPFPVFGRSAFGTKGIHLVSVVRAIVACGWFGIQTWVGGLALYSIWNVLTSHIDPPGLNTGEFVGFGVFWFLNMFFIWKGTESIKWLEDWSAPILILIGIILIGWGVNKVGSFESVLNQGPQLGKKAAEMVWDKENDHLKITLNPLLDLKGQPKADSVGIFYKENQKDPLVSWKMLQKDELMAFSPAAEMVRKEILEGTAPLFIGFKNKKGKFSESSCFLKEPGQQSDKLWDYLLWFTAMVGFWATMSISISDITRYAKSQSDQIQGQFLGLPGTMIFYSFVGIFVTCAAVLAFDDILIAEDAPWDPVTLVSKFNSPVVVVFAQISMLIATLSTNIAANVIAPANAFSNLSPKNISFKSGGYIAGIIGIVICPWWLMNEISGILIFISGLLGPVLGILICDYFLIRNKKLDIKALFDVKGEYAFGGSGIHNKAMIALFAGVFAALIGYWVESLSFLYQLSWLTGFGISFLVYFLIVPKKKQPEKT